MSSEVLEAPRYSFDIDARGIDIMPHSIFDPSAFKIRTKCNEEKPLSDFARPKLGKNGRYSQCKECKREAKRIWHAKNRESQIEKMRDYQERNRAALIANSRAAYRENRGKMIEAARQRYWNEPEKARQSARENRRKNPEKHRAQVAVANAVKRGLFPPVWTMVCEGCQEAQAAHWHHHTGYTHEFKLHVAALCTECHGREHRVS